MARAQDARWWVQVLAEAHKNVVPHEVVWLRPGPASSSLTPSMRDALESWSRAERVQDTSGLESDTFAFFRERTLSDGSEWVRFERRHLTSGGPAEPATSVEIWGPGVWIESPRLGAREGTLHRLVPTTVEEMLSIRRRGITPYEETRATAGSYVELARFAGRVLSECGDARVVSADEVTGTLESDAYGLETVIDRRTGELLACTLRFSWGEDLYKFEGRLQEPLFPARHPVRMVTRRVRFDQAEGAGAAPRSVKGHTLSVESLHRLDKAPAELFQWQSVCQTAFDVSAGVVLTADERIDDDATARRHRTERARGTVPFKSGEDGRLVPAATGRSVASKGLIAAGLTCLVAALVVLGRRAQGS